ncbi:hypothetical protein D3C78_1529810 [compost metagenome]
MSHVQTALDGTVALGLRDTAEHVVRGQGSVHADVEVANGAVNGFSDGEAAGGHGAGGGDGEGQFLEHGVCP